MSPARAESTPTVTVPPRPKGLPIAIVQAPGSILSESPQVATVIPGRGSILSTAISVDGSRPISFAGTSVLSVKRTWISLALSTTWLFVTMWPSGLTMNPEPSDVLVCARGSPKRRRNRSPKGRSAGSPRASVFDHLLREDGDDRRHLLAHDGGEVSWNRRGLGKRRRYHQC